LIKSNLSSQPFFPNIREVEPSIIENFTTYTKELRMLSVYEFYTEVLGKDWPYQFDSINQKDGNESKFKRSTNRIASEANSGESFRMGGMPIHSAEEENDESLSIQNEKISEKQTNTQNKQKPNAKSKRPRQLSQPLSAVPELKSMVDTDDFSTFSSSNDPVTKIPTTRDDDASVMSFGSLAASSVGSLSLRSVDSCSVEKS